MIRVEDGIYNVTACIPEYRISDRVGVVELNAIVEKRRLGPATLTVESQRAGVLTQAKLRLHEVEVTLALGKRYSPAGATAEIHAPSAEMNGASISLGENASWKLHPRQNEAKSGALRSQVQKSWSTYPAILEEIVGIDGIVQRKGLRKAQAGALHALASHWSVKDGHALVVLPTGTGKTEVLIAASLLLSAERTLVVVPSDSLRAQTVDKFVKLGVLEEIGVIDDQCLTPVVGLLSKSPKSEQDISALLNANVVVTTTQMLLSTENSIIEKLLEVFDLVTFDEAHHLPAASWERIRQRIPSSTKILSLTATPFRNDGKRIPGELVYQFPLRLAQRYGYFTKINVVKVDQSDAKIADEAIARAAVQVLRQDAVEGFDHVILARSRSIDHANSLLDVYQRLAPEYSPVLLHSGMARRKKEVAIESMKSLVSRVVICVDMLGEGFDFSALKIAAMHELHKSLPVTLQFVGRFTRASNAVGSATVIINTAEPMADTAVAELFSEDADWNEIVPELSASAIDSDAEVKELAQRMRQLVSPDDKVFDISLISPGLSSQFYRVENFEPGALTQWSSKDSMLHQIWMDQENGTLVAITRDYTSPDWSKTKDARGFEWNLFIVSYDSDKSLLMVNSTLGRGKTKRLVETVSRKTASPIAGEHMFRAFSDMKRAVLHNVGLRKRGQVRFQMLVGIDVGQHVSQAIQAGSSKSNLFAAGYVDGVKESIGVSFRGKVWSMASASLPQWLAWARKISRKILDSTIPTNSFLAFTLIPTEIVSPPPTSVFSCIPPDELLPGSYHGEKRLRYSGSTLSVTQSNLDFQVVSRDADSIDFEVRADGQGTILMKMTWGGGYKVSRIAGPDVFVMDEGHEVSLQSYLSDNPPALILVDGSEIVGGHHFKYLSSPVYSFSAASISTPDWTGVNLRLESMWKGGLFRSNSIQEFMVTMLKSGSYDYIIDDDDSGEVADVIAIEDDRVGKELRVSLYHCKYAHGSSAGARVADLYEVCGQAIKSCRILNRAEDLVAHIIRRESQRGGRPTRFEVGDIGGMKSLKTRVSTYRMSLQIFIVQPGLSAGALTPDLSSILGSAENFVLEFTGRRLGVVASA